MAARRRKKGIKQTHEEIWGVVLIALSIFFGVCLYLGATGIVGEVVAKALFGLTGLFAYAAPPIILTGGILLIACARGKSQRGRALLVAMGIYFILTLLHIGARPLLNGFTFIEYIKDAYETGSIRLKGGGVFGGALAYPLLLLTGKAGAYIFTISGLLIIILIVTRLSLREAGQRVKNQVAAGVQIASQAISTRKQNNNLYMENLEAAEPATKRGKRGKEKAPAKERAKKRSLLDEDEELEFLPCAGPLQKKPDEREFFENDLPIEYYEGGEGRTPHGNNSLRGAKGKDSAHYDEYGYEDSYLEIREEKNTAARIKRNTGKAEGIEDRERAPYVFPPFDLLNPAGRALGRGGEAPAETGRLLIETLNSFNVSARILNISVGPVITRFEIAPAPGVRVNKITALSDDIALALAAPRVRIEAPIPGKAAVGIEVPNKNTGTVVLRDVVESREFASSKSDLTLALGKDIAGKVIVADLAKMPHLLIAGATGSGKSVCINDIIISLTYKCTPEQLQLILVDPKVVELNAFGALPHLKAPVVTDPKKAAGALAGGVREMTERYKAFAKCGARDLARYNEINKEKPLPKLVIIIDELADLMMVAPDTVEDSICRIAQLGRASGIHLIVATQRPSADVITGLIKANIPSRIAFSVASAIDSRIILDSGGAEKLLGRGDMLFHPNGANKPMRVQGAFVGDDEVERIAEHFRQYAMQPEFDDQLIGEMEEGIVTGNSGINSRQEDELLGEAVRVVMDSGQASISMIQRRLRVGYARAARLVDIMEQKGFVSGFDGSKPRRLLISRMQYEQLFGNLAGEENETWEEKDYDDE